MTSYTRAVLMVLFAGVCLSTAGIGIRSLDAATGTQIVFYRSIGLSAMIFFVLLVQSRGRPWQSFAEVGGVGLLAGLFFAICSYAIVHAFIYTTVANTMFIVSLAPFFTAIFAWLWLKEPVPKATWLAIGIAVAGVLTMIQGALSGNGLKGIAFAFAMAVSYGLFMVTVRAGRSQNMLPALCWSGVLLALVIGFSQTDLNVSRYDMLVCLGLGVFQTGLGGLLLVYGAQRLPAAQVTVLAMLEIVLSPLWVWLWVNEQPGAATLVGGSIIVIAIAVQAVSETRQTAEEA